MREIFYVNGNFVERDKALVSIEDRGYQFADGVYEVTRFHGRRGLCIAEHQQRLQQSASHLRIAGQPTIEQWQSIINELMDRSEISDDPASLTCLYQQVTRGNTPRAHTFPKSAVAPGVVAYFKSAPVYTLEQRHAGISLSIQPDERWDRCYIKSICLLPAILAKQAAVEAGAFEAVLVRDGYVTEGGSTNIFCVINGVIHTHPTGGKILTGITRGLALEAAARTGMEVIEQPIPLEDFQNADEIFVCSTTLDLMPATTVEGRPIGTGTAGPVTRRLIDTMMSLVQADVAASPESQAVAHTI